nr:alpha/beta hydrolase [Nitrosomonas nitrosa]
MSSSPFREGRATLNSLSIHFLDWGSSSAEPIVLLHSLSGFCRDWDRFAASLADRYRLIAVDMRGFGDSDRDPAGRYQPLDFASDAIALADHLGLGKFSVIGHSLGGRGALALAHRHPDRIERLVLVDVGPEFDADGQVKLRQRVAGTPTVFSSLDEAYICLRPHFAKTDEGSLRTWLKDYVRPTPAGLEVKRDPLFNQRFADALAGRPTPPQPDLWGPWKALTCPVLILRGTLSNLLTPKLVERMLAVNSQARCVEIGDAGHNIPADNPRALLAAVRDFFHNVTAPGESECVPLKCATESKLA